MDHDGLVEGIVDILLEVDSLDQKRENYKSASAYWAGRRARDKERKDAGFAAPLTKKQQEARRNSEIDAHFAKGGPHDKGECGPVCTAFDW